MTGANKCMNILMFSAISNVNKYRTLDKQKLKVGCYRLVSVLTHLNANSSADMYGAELAAELEAISGMLCEEVNNCWLLLKYISTKCCKMYPHV
jgi:hypothetical protein